MSRSWRCGQKIADLNRRVAGVHFAVDDSEEGDWRVTMRAILVSALLDNPAQSRIGSHMADEPDCIVGAARPANIAPAAKLRVKVIIRFLS